MLQATVGTVAGMPFNQCLTRDVKQPNTIALRGFTGLYSVTVEHNGATTSHPLMLDKDGTYQITLPASP